MSLTVPIDDEEERDKGKRTVSCYIADGLLKVKRTTFFTWKFSKIILFLSLIVGPGVLVKLNTTLDSVTQTATSRNVALNRDVGGGRIVWTDSNDSSVPHKNDDSVGFGSPPSAYPWHRWGSPSIDVRPLLTELSLIEEFSLIEELSTPFLDEEYDVGFNTTFDPLHYRTLMPYVVRNGVAFHRKKKETMVKSKRWKLFEEMLSESLRIAKTLVQQEQVDPRIEALVTGEFPFILSHGDFTNCSDYDDKLVPIFSWYTYTNITSCNYSWPVPDYHVWAVKKITKKQWDRQFLVWAEQDYPWETKLPKAIWRGSLTGPEVEDWHELPRVKLVQQSMMDQQHTIDAAFAGRTFKKKLNVTEEMVRNESRVVPAMLEQDFMKYRAIIDIDGYTWSSRYSLLLCFNSVVIKVESEYMAYYESELRPWEHYIPVNANMTDLESAVSFAVSDENHVKVQAIIQNAQSWCRSRLVKEQLATDFMWILASYVELLNAEGGGWHDAWKENEQAFNLTAMEMQEIVLRKKRKRRGK